MRLLAMTALAIPAMMAGMTTTRPACAGSLSAYTITDIGPASAASRSFGLAINASGQVAGAADAEHAVQAFRSSGSGPSQGLGSLAGDRGHSRASGIDAGGVVVGTSDLGDGRTRAFRSDGGGMTDLGTLPGGSWSEAVAINGRGEVAGTGDRADGATVAFRITAGGDLVELGTLDGGGSSRARGINNLGQVVGEAQDDWGITRAFIADERGIRFAGTLPGGGASVALAINDDGLITGHATDSSGREMAFVGRPGRLAALGVLPGGRDSYGLAINASGRVVGSVSMLGGARAFLWTAEDGMVDLNLLIGPGSGWVLQSASGITDDGLIVGTGTFLGVSRAFVLRPNAPGPPTGEASDPDGPGPWPDGTPPGGGPPHHAAPEPGTLALVLLGAGGVGSWAWARQRRGRRA